MLRKNHPKPLQHGSRAAVLVSELRLPSPIVWFDRSLIEPIVSPSGPLTRPQSPPPSWWVMLRRSSPSSLCWDSTRTKLHPLPPTTTHSMVRSATSNIASNQRAEQVFLVFLFLLTQHTKTPSLSSSVLQELHLYVLRRDSPEI